MNMRNIGSSIGGWIGGMFGDNPADEYEDYTRKGMREINRGVNQATGYLEPYRTNGMEALKKYMGMLSEYENPTKKYNDIMNGWSMSPGAKNMLNGALDKVKNEMAVRGLTNSGQEFADLGKTYEDYASQDQRNYLKDILGIEGTGLTGFEGLSKLGQNTASQSGQFAMEGAGDMASLFSAIAKAKADQAAAENARNSDLGAGIGSALGSGVASIFGL